MRLDQRTWVRRVRTLGAISALFCAIAPGFAQISTDRNEGLRDNTPRFHALTGARLVIAPGQVIENGTLVMRDGVIVAAGTAASVAVPAGARIWSLSGRTVYAGFIDLASNVGVPSALRAPPPTAAGTFSGEVAAPVTPPPVRPLAARAGASRNARVHPEQDVSQQLEFKADDIKLPRELGFTTVLASPSTGVFRGQSALINLSAGKDAKAMLLAPRAAMHLANEIDRSRRGVYPNSLMGSIALVRQTLYDARWYRSAIDGTAKSQAASERPEANASLDALASALAGRQPVFYVADDEQAYQRIAKVRDEFGLRVVLQGNGNEYRRAQQLKTLALPVIVPLNFPAAPEVENPDTALDSSFEALERWEQAPSNLAMLNLAGVEFAVTPAGLKDIKKEFWQRLRESIKRGLPADRALAGLTTVPAKLIGEQRRLGSLEAGHIANVVVAKGDIFTDESAAIEMTFVDGQPYTTDAWGRFDARGTWEVKSAPATSSGTSTVWSITGTPTKPQLKINGVACAITLRGDQLVTRLPCSAGDAAGANASEVIVAEGRADTLRGTSQVLGGALKPWIATRTAAYVEPPPTAKPTTSPAALRTQYPAGAFGITQPTRPAALLVKNATVWTSAAAGRLARADVLVRDGKIVAIGENLSAPAGAVVIDAMSKHVTPGIIDAHSHTAIIGGVNEGTSSVTSEVRIADVIDATDINIYRELGGGVTTANILHGSANTIGGQNQVIKLRWGSDAEALKLEGAMPGIKFALGENVKQSNWGDQATSRYPQTRLGVEQILRDAFAAANSYRAAHNAWRQSSRIGPEPRRDLQLDTLVEILDKKRVVHIHSYRADEILMFARLSQEFGFTVATFQHVLEGYKVADVIAKIGAGGSTFSDWWAYKMEVIDAIPYNAALMQSAGVVASFNSDSDELARRLNVEAAKAVKYGGMSETDALKLVTINPAKQLRIDARVGSLEVGKDADFVIWSGSPLSTFSRAEQTWIEGRRYFDLDTDQKLREEAARERARLVAKALPVRLAAVSIAAAMADKSNDAAEAKPDAPQSSVSEMLQFLALQRWLHDQSRLRTEYWTGADSHECTEDMR
ncbi:MAG: amidohydrolase family protein [Usitatibacteraceae bacterium]